MIEVRHLSKRYGTHLAVDDLSFSIDRGVVYGFLGPNGAGKSTTMNIMTGCLGATEGEVLIDGHNVAEEPMEAKKHIGYLPELPPLYGDMTPEEYLRFVARAKGLRREESARQIETVMEKTRIADVRKRLIRNLSKGYRQRVGIAQALLGNPEVIILDEPTVGLDPAQIIEIRELIRELGKEHTLVLSSHILSEVQAVCDSILILSKGRLVACDTAENLTKLMRGRENLRLLTRAEEETIRPIVEKVDGVESLAFAEEGRPDRRRRDPRRGAGHSRGAVQCLCRSKGAASGAAHGKGQPGGRVPGADRRRSPAGGCLCLQRNRSTGGCAGRKGG